MSQIEEQISPLLIVKNIIYSLSLYSPIIICVSIVLFSMFTVTINKAFVFFLWVLVITSIRIGLLILSRYMFKEEKMNQLPFICSTGLTDIIIPQDVWYSTYLLTFTFMYFIAPMFMISAQNNVNIINYGVIAFFIFYIILDIGIKISLSCIHIPINIKDISNLTFTDKFKLSGKSLFGNAISGAFLGIFIALGMYGTELKGYLYINEINSNKEVCSMPSKQQFKCKVYKDGALVGNI